MNAGDEVGAGEHGGNWSARRRDRSGNGGAAARFRTSTSDGRRAILGFWTPEHFEEKLDKIEQCVGNQIDQSVAHK